MIWVGDQLLASSAVSRETPRWRLNEDAVVATPRVARATLLSASTQIPLLGPLQRGVAGLPRGVRCPPDRRGSARSALCSVLAGPPSALRPAATTSVWRDSARGERGRIPAESNLSSSGDPIVSGVDTTRGEVGASGRRPWTGGPWASRRDGSGARSFVSEALVRASPLPTVSGPGDRGGNARGIHGGAPRGIAMLSAPGASRRRHSQPRPSVRPDGRLDKVRIDHWGTTHRHGGRESAARPGTGSDVHGSSGLFANRAVRASPLNQLERRPLNQRVGTHPADHPSESAHRFT